MHVAYSCIYMHYSPADDHRCGFKIVEPSGDARRKPMKLPPLARRPHNSLVTTCSMYSSVVPACSTVSVHLCRPILGMRPAAPVASTLLRKLRSTVIICRAPSSSSTTRHPHQRTPMSSSDATASSSKTVADPDCIKWTRIIMGHRSNLSAGFRAEPRWGLENNVPQIGNWRLCPRAETFCYLCDG